MTTLPNYDEVVDKAIGLGGWKVDPADPYKAPYNPTAAASAAMKWCGWPEDDPDYRDSRDDIADTVRFYLEDDPTTREEIEQMREEWSARKANERGAA